MSENMVLATIPRSATEEIQVKVSEYKGKKYLDLRIFYTTDNGATWLPTKKGVAVYPENLELLKEAIELAQKEFE
jgi:hypothetical protein